MKNYVVIIKNVEKTKVEQMLNYLENDNHKNHSSKTTILQKNKNHKQLFLSRNNDKIEKNLELWKERNGKGKQLKNSNKSLTFNIPKSYEFTNKDLFEIEKKLKNMILHSYKVLGVDLKDNDLFFNIHKQKNTHINFIIPILNNNGGQITWKNPNTNKIIRYINSKGFLNHLSKSFTNIVDNVLNTNINTYKTLQDKEKKLNKDLVEVEEKDLVGCSLSDLEELKKKKENNRLLKRFYTYVIRLKKKENDLIEDSKTINNLNNTISKIMEDKKVDKEELEELTQILKVSKLLTKLDNNVKDTIRRNRK